jgi:hypothetical protein
LKKWDTCGEKKKLRSWEAEKLRKKEEKKKEEEKRRS